MSRVIYYKTKYGSTEDYARWLSTELGFKMINIKKRPRIGTDNIVIIGSNLMFGKVRAASWIKKNWKKMEDKKVVLFFVGSSRIGWYRSRLTGI